jgi:hypothetical protein
MAGSPSAEPDLRQRLLLGKLGDLMGWEIPAFLSTIGPNDPTAFEEFNAKRLKIIRECLERLESYSVVELQVILTGPEEAGGTRAAWRQFLRDEIDRLSRKTPPWYASGFGHPRYVADFEYWAKMPRFSIREITCLSVGIDPQAFLEREFTDLSRASSAGTGRTGRTGDGAILWPSIQFLLRRKEQLMRRFDPQSHGWNASPRDFLVWVVQVDFETHPEFLRLLRLYHDPGSVPATTPPDKREIDKIALLFTAMAIETYGYDPDDPRSPVTKDIGDLAASLGLAVSDDTIRKYLRIGAAFLPDGWKDK